MKIVAVILCGGEGRKEMAVRAALSVALLVDEFLLVDTGTPSQETIQAVRDALRGGGFGGFICSPMVSVYTGEPICGAMRNHALDAAAGMGDWAMQLDTDETWNGDPQKTRAFLEATSADVVIAWNNLGTYTKERFFRLPAKGRFSTSPPVHEGYADGEQVSTRTLMPLEDFSFWEESKSDDQQKTNDEVIAKLCRETLEKDPKNHRAAYYLADALVRLGNPDEAERLFELAADCSQYHQESGWALFRAACCAYDKEFVGKTVDFCREGMARAPMFPEFPWLIAMTKLKSEKPHEALAYSNMAIALGTSTNLQQQGYVRLGFRFPPAHTYGPWEVRRNALMALGQTAAAEEAHAMVLHQVAKLPEEAQNQFRQRTEKPAGDSGPAEDQKEE